MNLNQSDDTKRTAVETSKIDDISDEALDRAPWQGALASNLTMTKMRPRSDAPSRSRQELIVVA
jgi:hypothetical protein